MSVAIVVDTFPRWSERFIARELNELMRRGVGFKIYCLRAGDSDCDRDPEFAGLLPHRVVLPSCFLPSFARNLGMDAAAKERMKRVEDALGLTAFRQIGCADSLAKIIRENRHEKIYAHFASLPSTLAWLAAESLNLPFYLSAHARDVFVDGQLLAEKIGRARTVFTCNEKAFDALRRIEMGLGMNGRTVLMRHGLALEQFAYQERQAHSSADGKALRLLAAGRFVSKKGFDDLIEALALPELRHTKISLTLLGDGPERKALARRIARLGLPERIVMPGVVLDGALRAHYAAADAFIMPSVETNDGDSDGMPNVVLEALATGLPVIGTRAGSLGDVLDVTTGFIAPVADGDLTPPRALAMAILDLFADPQNARTKALRARAAIETRYDIRKNIEPLVVALTESNG